jgi:predicted TIM-barrel fold metal-dependent hydrolase
MEHGLRDLKLKGLAELSLGDWLPESLETAQNEMRDCFALCKSYGDLPITVHAHAGGGAQDAGYCDPSAFEPLARDFPTVPLILCHMGGARRDFFEHALAVAKKYDNIRFNTSQATPEHLTEAVKQIGAERIHFGVDWYALDEPETKERSQHRNQLEIVAKAKMTDRQRELVMGESLASLLKI